MVNVYLDKKHFDPQEKEKSALSCFVSPEDNLSEGDEVIYMGVPYVITACSNGEALAIPLYATV